MMATTIQDAMPEGIGDLTYGTPEWVSTARDALTAAIAESGSAPDDVPGFTLCEVACNPPAHLHVDGPLAWHAIMGGSEVKVAPGELPAEDCDLKVRADHSILSNLARIHFESTDPRVVAAVQGRLHKLSRWQVDGELPAEGILGDLLRSLHDKMAERTMPRLVFMTPEWVGIARHILTTRAESPRYAEGLRDVDYTFAEEFTETPRYAFPDGSHGGFWVRCENGRLTVGAGPLPKELEPADHLTRGLYTPVVPVGRTVNATMTDAETAEQAEYSKTAFRFDREANRRPVEQSSPSGRGPMPDGLGKVMSVLHDELSRRTSGELPADYDDTVRPEWAKTLSFDRRPDYDPSWVRYDRFDIYGEPLS